MSFIQIISEEGIIFEVTKEEISCSKLLNRIINNLNIINQIPLNNISNEILIIIHHFMKLSIRPTTENWVNDFILDHLQYFQELLISSNFLEIDLLTNGLIEIINNIILNNNNLNDLRLKLGIKNDLNEEEEKILINKISWAFS